MSHSVVSAVDLNALDDWMQERGLGDGRLEFVDVVTGGTQNVMLRLARGGLDFVLRRGPANLRPRSNEAIRREIRVLGALATTAVPHPKLIAASPDETVLGAVFYLMEPVDGFNPDLELPDLHRSDPEARRATGLSAAAALAALGCVDHQKVGLEDFGKPEGFLERQVPRWLAELDSYAMLEGYPGPQIPHVEAVADWLERNRPTTWTPGIMHGDSHLNNMMFSRVDPQVAAIVDWEMCTIGDPLLDLGWLVATWDLPPGTLRPGSQLFAAGGLPTTEELVAHYAQRSDRDLAAISWYTVLACFKLGLVIEGTYARAHAGLAPMEVGEMLHTTTLELFRRAAEFIRQS